MAKCKVCKSTYIAIRPMQQVCSIQCAIDLSRMKAEKAHRKSAIETRKQTRLAKEKLKTRSEWAKEAQAAFNAWIRYRDRDQPCISCQRHHSGQYHAGHYRSVGSNPALRFEPLNVHKQCSVCNNYQSGNLIEYRINLERKIGADKLAWLEGPHDAKKYSVEELIEIRDKYRSMVNQAKKIPTI